MYFKSGTGTALGLYGHSGADFPLSGQQKSSWRRRNLIRSIGGSKVREWSADCSTLSLPPFLKLDYGNEREGGHGHLWTVGRGTAIWASLGADRVPSPRDRCPPVDLFSNLDTPKATRNPIEKALHCRRERMEGERERERERREERNSLTRLSTARNLDLSDISVSLLHTLI